MRAKMRRPSGAWPMPLVTMSSACMRVMSWTRIRMLPAAAGGGPGTGPKGGGLACAVGPDQGDDLSLVDMEADATQGLDASIKDVDPLDLEQHAHQADFPRLGSEQRGAGPPF